MSPPASVGGTAGRLLAARHDPSAIIYHGHLAVPVQDPGSGGGLGGLIHTILHPISSGAGALAGVGLAAVGSWVLAGARAALDETAKVIGTTTAPQLDSTWFSSTYWRVAGLAALLTLPFLFAAAAQALMRSDLSLLLRAAFGYLPAALLGVSLAAPLTMLLLAATDQMCAVVSGAGAGGGARFLANAALAAGGISALNGSAFLAFAVGLFTAAAAVTLAVEMLIRQAAVYVVVLMLPLAFAGFVWPARRIWTVRALELLVALILSKFAIVAVLSLAGAAYGSAGTPGASTLLSAMALVTLSAFAPWALLRLLPFTELAAGAHSAIRSEAMRMPRAAGNAAAAAGTATEWTAGLSSAMLRQAEDAGQGAGRTAADLTGSPALPAGSGADRLGSAEEVSVTAGDTPASAGQAPDSGGEAPASAGEALAMTGARMAGGATAPVAATAGAAAGHGSGEQPATRLPQFADELWHAPNLSWRPVELGPYDEGVTPAWPADEAGPSPDHSPDPDEAP
jgi:hypothetical protein